MGNPKSAEPEHTEMTAGRNPGFLERAGHSHHRRQRSAATGRDQREALVRCHLGREPLQGWERFGRRHGRSLEGQSHQGSPRVLDQPGVLANPVDPLSPSRDHVEILTESEDVQDRTQHTPIVHLPARSDQGPRSQSGSRHSLHEPFDSAEASHRAHARVMSQTMPSAQPKIPRGVIVLVWVVIALLLVVVTLVEFARGIPGRVQRPAAGW